MSRFLTAGTITGVLGFLAVVASMFGFEAVSLILKDPNTASVIQEGIGLAMMLVAAFMGGVKPASNSID